MKRMLLAAAASSALSACASAPTPRAPATADAKAALEKADLDFAAATAARGVDGWLEFFSDDGAQMNAKGEITRGKEAIRRDMADYLTKTKLVWHPLLADVASSGDFGFTYGVYEASRPDEHGAPKIIAK